MRAAGLVALGLLLGFVLGGMAPRRTLEQRDEELAECHAERDAACEGTTRGIPGLDRILGRPPERAVEVEAEHEVETEVEVEVEVEAETEVEVETGGGGEVRVVGSGPDGGVPMAARPSRLERLHLAAEAQALRAAATRAAIIERAELSDEEVVRLDAILGRTNDRLLGFANEIAVVMVDVEDPPPGEMLGIMNDVTGVLRDGQVELEVLLDGRAGGGADRELAIWNFVDLQRIDEVLTAREEER